MIRAEEKDAYLLLRPSIMKGQFHWTQMPSVTDSLVGAVQNWYPLPHQRTQDPPTSSFLEVELEYAR